MHSVIAGTAGHIDHGKSALVEALTGTHPDRLEEERRRGITIDLGFAHCDLPLAAGGAVRLSFIDVPGHERFVANMLAGIGGIDLVLLAVAADQAVQPQTREHFEICRLLGIERGLVALTKCDLADAEMRLRARLELDELLRGTFLERAPRIETSVRTGAGLAELKTALARLAAEVPERNYRRPARLPLDRVFSLKGFGAVVTGTLASGTIASGAELSLLGGDPAKPEMARWACERVRVRGIEVHGEAVARVRAGQRTALNLAGIEAAELRRGWFAVPPGSFAACGCLYAELELLRTAPALKPHTRIELHAYSAAQAASLAPLETPRLEPGSRGLVEVRLKIPLPLVPGDRFIIRQLSPPATLGGGVVLEARPRRVRPSPLHLAWLRAWREAAHSPAAPAAHCARRVELLVQQAEPEGLEAPAIGLRTGWATEEIAAALAAGERAGELAQVGACWLAAAPLQARAQAMLEALAAFHREQPLLAGAGLDDWRRRAEALQPIPSARRFQQEAERLAAEGRVEAREGLFHLPGQGQRLSGEEEAARRKLEAIYRDAGLEPPATAAALADLGIDPARARRLLQMLLREQALTQISPALLLHRQALAELRRRLDEYKSQSRRLSVAEFKQLAGISRKYAIPLLEYLDSQRITRRAGDHRELL